MEWRLVRACDANRWGTNGFMYQVAKRTWGAGRAFLRHVMRQASARRYVRRAKDAKDADDISGS